MPVILLKNFEFFFVSPSFVAALVLSVQKKIDFFLVSPCVVASMPEKKNGNLFGCDLAAPPNIYWVLGFC